MKIVVNEEQMTVADALTVTQLLDDLACNTPGTALALNASVLPRGQWAQRVLRQGDELVIFQAIAGG